MTDNIQKKIAKAMVEGPHFERVGETSNGKGLYELSSFDHLVYLRGLQSLRESEKADKEGE